MIPEPVFIFLAAIMCVGIGFSLGVSLTWRKAARIHRESWNSARLFYTHQAKQSGRQ